MKFVRQIPNIVTSIRIAAAIAIIFLPAMSVEFLIVYGVCGLSDAIDGFLARKLHAESRFGSILDSVSDLIFYTVMAVKIFPVMQRLLEVQHWVIMGVVTALHLLAYVICAIKYQRFSAVHTYANKLLGAVVFLFPFALIGEIYLLYSLYIYIFGVFAFYGAVEINLIHLLSTRYDTRVKSIFLLKKFEADESPSETKR